MRPGEVAEAAAKLATEHDLVLVEGAADSWYASTPPAGALADVAGLLGAPVLVVTSAGSAR
ncbi:ATP-dependent dethiobiotin synthetase BioD OS=Streptomyces tendae OX=1932 GN=bioD PE=3 SV=1 [Streptomyces tendae]